MDLHPKCIDQLYIFKYPIYVCQKFYGSSSGEIALQNLSPYQLGAVDNPSTSEPHAVLKIDFWAMAQLETSKKLQGFIPDKSKNTKVHLPLIQSTELFRSRHADCRNLTHPTGQCSNCWSKNLWHTQNRNCLKNVRKTAWKISWLRSSASHWNAAIKNGIYPHSKPHV